MTSSVSIEARALTKETLKEVTRLGGPCVSIFFAPYAPGSGAGADPVWLANALDEIRNSLQGHHFEDAEIARLLRPVEDLAARGELSRGHAGGEAWFLAPEGMARLATTGETGRGFALGQQPFVLPLLGALTLPEEYYVLGVAKRDVALFRCAHGTIAKVPLPDSIPAGFEANGAGDPATERDNRAPSGSEGGRLRSVRFSTAEEESTERLRQYFKLLDRKIAAILEPSQAPVVLAGVHYEAAEFRHSAESLNVIAEGAVDGAFHDRTPAELLAKSAEVLRGHQAAVVAGLARAMRESARRLDNTTEILRASLEGRVWRLFLTAEPAGEWLRSWTSQIELNRVAVEAIRHGAEICLTPASEMPAGTRAVATLRY